VHGDAVEHVRAGSTTPLPSHAYGTTWVGGALLDAGTVDAAGDPPEQPSASRRGSATAARMPRWYHDACTPVSAAGRSNDVETHRRRPNVHRAT
jgi:hypothetical protein